jgi:hypothetical protein
VGVEPEDGYGVAIAREQVGDRGEFGSTVAGEVEEAIGPFPIQEVGCGFDVMEDFVPVVDSVGSV